MNNFYRYIIIIIFSLPLIAKGNTNLSLPQKIDIRIFSGSEINEINLTSLEGRYLLYSDNETNAPLLSLRKFSTIKIKAKDSKILIIRRDTIIHEVSKVLILGGAFNNIMLLNPIEPDLAFRMYDDDFVIMAADGKLKIINNVSLEKYIAGVVQSESGFLRHAVYYQVQATIARTYAFKNINRHEAQGHNLCDQVHCQAYYGRTGYNPIIEAVNDSRGTIIIDRNSQPVNTVYHANCGGETINSEDIWPQALPYLRSVKDTFCLNSPGAKWEMKISIDDLLRFVESSYKIKLSESEKTQILTFTQDNRKLYLDENKKIHLRQIRENFKLRSTFFSVLTENDTIIFRGRGFGHGVGLCQEGAMKMAQYGFSKEYIIKYYYKNIELVVIDDFFAN